MNLNSLAVNESLTVCKSGSLNLKGPSHPEGGELTLELKKAAFAELGLQGRRDICTKDEKKTSRRSSCYATGSSWPIKQY